MIQLLNHQDAPGATGSLIPALFGLELEWSKVSKFKEKVELPTKLNL